MHRVLKIGRWVVDFIFVVKDYDIEGILGCLYDCEARSVDLKRAEEIMESRKLNCGFTFSNPDIFRAVVVIGPTSSGAEFVDTFTHEIHHLAVNIAAELGIDLESETPAYIAGDSARALADAVCKMGCQCCRHE